MISQAISHYRILDKLGASGMGEVYLAEDTRLRRKVALKLLPEDLTGNEEILRRFKQEAGAAWPRHGSISKSEISNNKTVPPDPSHLPV